MGETGGREIKTLFHSGAMMTSGPERGRELVALSEVSYHCMAHMNGGLISCDAHNLHRNLPPPQTRNPIGPLF